MISFFEKAQLIRAGAHRLYCDCYGPFTAVVIAYRKRDPLSVSVYPDYYELARLTFCRYAGCFDLHSEYSGMKDLLLPD